MYAQGHGACGKSMSLATTTNAFTIVAITVAEMRTLVLDSTLIFDKVNCLEM